MSDDVISVFDAHGSVRDLSSFPDEQLLALSEDRRNKLAALTVASSAMKDAEQAQRDAMSVVDVRVKELRAAEVATCDARPKVTHSQIARAHARAGRGEVGTPVDPAVEKKIIAAAAAADKANLALAAAHKAKAMTDTAVKSTRGSFARALQSWTASGPIVTQRDLIRAVAATQADRDRVEQAAAAVAPQSVLDAVLRGSGGKRGPTISRARRMHVPSER